MSSARRPLFDCPIYDHLMERQAREGSARAERQIPLLFEAVVSRVTDLTHDVREIALALVQPGAIAFAPGQFVSFSIAQPGKRFAATRAYSIVSSPDRTDEIVLLLNRVPGGPGSEYLFGLSEGDRTSFRGPFGTFVLRAGTTPLLLVAADTGIAPLWSMLAWLAAHEPDRPTMLLWELQAERDLYYQEELQRLRERMPGFSWTVTLARPQGDWHGALGDVAALVDRLAPDAGPASEAFVCGSSAMIAKVRAQLESRDGWTVHREQYYISREL